jgi:hypothetical protein
MGSTKLIACGRAMFGRIASSIEQEIAPERDRFNLMRIMLYKHLTLHDFLRKIGAHLHASRSSFACLLRVTSRHKRDLRLD